MPMDSRGFCLVKDFDEVFGTFQALGAYGAVSLSRCALDTKPMLLLVAVDVSISGT